MHSIYISIFLSLMLTGSFAQSTNQDGPVYKSGYSSIMKLGKDLYSALEPQQRAKLSSQPISIETEVKPSIRLLYYEDDSKPIRGVWISAGFIDLVNYVAHAEAIDRKKKNYFKRYMILLSRETGEKSLGPLPEAQDPEFWKEDTLNEQLSNFNSIVGLMLGVKFAHHYLGHYDKYKDKLTDPKGNPISINQFLTEQEWKAAFLKGARNALEAGCTLEGALPFFEALDKMEHPPAWTAFFLPEKVKFSAIKKEVERAQEKFFKGE